MVLKTKLVQQKQTQPRIIVKQPMLTTYMEIEKAEKNKNKTQSESNIIKAIKDIIRDINNVFEQEEDYWNQ